MTDTLVDFVRARLDENEAAAQAASPGPWHADGGHVYATHPTDEVVDYVGDSAAHIARHDPARVLAQVAAMRAIVDWAEDLERACLDDGIYGIEPDTPVRRLAAIWRDHDDYDSAWAPEGE